MSRLKAVQALLEQMEAADEIDEAEVAKAAEVAALMQSLARDLGEAVGEGIRRDGLPAAEAERLRLGMERLKALDHGHD